MLMGLPAPSSPGARRGVQQSRWALALLVMLLLNPARGDEVTLAIRLNTVGYVPQAEKKARIFYLHL